jgi:hypothetical protein
METRSMKLQALIVRAGAVAALVFSSLIAAAAEFPAPVEGVWIARDFKFASGDVMPEVRLAYTTVGDPRGEPVLVLHGTTGSAASRSTQANISSSWLTRSATANRPNPLTASARNFRATPTTIWCWRNTAWSPRAWGSSTCAW